MKYIWTDGKTYQGNNYRDIVIAMKNDSPFTEKESVSQFMRGVAKRVRMTHNVAIWTLTPFFFIYSLVRHGIICKG